MIRLLCALLVVCGLSWPALGEESKSMTAILLVARAGMPDSNFKDSVVLVTNKLRAPVGVIINKPTPIRVSDLFPEIEKLADLDDKVYFGGPVAVEAVSFIFRAAKPHEDTTQLLDGVYFSTSYDRLRELLGRPDPMEGLRIFAGYSSWGPRQLESEIGRGDWTLAPASANAIFDGNPERKWQDLQRPEGGQRASGSGAVEGAMRLIALRTIMQ